MLKYARAVEFDGNVPKTRRTRPVFHFIVATLAWLSATPAVADMTVMTDNTLFCPSWAEAHERSLAILNNGRPAYPAKWKGCIVLERGTCADVVDHQDQWTEIVIRGKHWFTDEMPDVIPGVCPMTSSATKRSPAH
jgi:hypothetical protein